MSTGADCHFTEEAPHRWTYRLQRWPYGVTDEYDQYGPFGSFGAAHAHLNEHHANPGGWSTTCLPEGEHVHEWATGEGWAPVGFEVEIRVESLGPDASPADVIRHVQALPLDHPAFRVRPVEGLVPNITTCAACGRTRTAERSRT
jgi:hypothetical protein